MRSYDAITASNRSDSTSNFQPTMTTSTVIDINHPYYLSASDHPGLSLVSELLTDQNYHHWSRSVKIALSAKLKLGFIDGTQVQPPANFANLSLWMRSNDLVISWILNSVSFDIKKSIVYMTTAKQIWDDLANRYCQTNFPRLFHLRKELSALTQGTKSITSYFTQFRGLMDELDTLSPIARCTCARNTCACGLSVKLDIYEQMIKLSQFLMGLNEQFTVTRGQILLMNPLPDLSHAYAMQTQKDECKVNDISLICDYCKLTGHVKDKCFALHGYPDWHRLYGQPKPKIRNTASKKAVAHNATHQNSAEMTSTSEHNSTLSDSSLMTEAQYNQLIQIL
ncbi:uncharacterized protein LOC141690873 [Apium graveolens]|uniref:uncharacterized protein LOC141690873 n=1 Tax=Apium graveolens TaxID=4045 RepID=UPI003D7C0B3D